MASITQLSNLKKDSLVWSKQGITSGTPKLAYFNYDFKNLHLHIPRVRIAFTPNPLMPPEKMHSSEGSPRAALPKYTLPVATNDVLLPILTHMESRICELLFEKKDQLYGAEAKKVRDVSTIGEFFYKSFLYEGAPSADGESRPPLFNAKIPLDTKVPGNFKVICHVMNDETGKPTEFPLTQANYTEVLRGGNDVEFVVRVKGVAVANSKAYPMLDVSHIIVYPKETAIDDTSNELEADALLAMVTSPPTLKRQTNMPEEIGEPQPKRSKK